MRIVLCGRRTLDVGYEHSASCGSRDIAHASTSELQNERLDPDDHIQLARDFGCRHLRHRRAAHCGHHVVDPRNIRE